MQNCHIAAALPPANCHTTPGSIIVILILVTIVVINIDNHICHNRYSNFNFPSAIINSCIREYWRSCIYWKMVKGHRLCITYHITSQFASSIVSVPFFSRSYLIRKAVEYFEYFCSRQQRQFYSLLVSQHGLAQLTGLL